MPEIHPASAHPGMTVSFRYYGCEELRTVTITSVDSEYICGIDEDKSEFRKFCLDKVLDLRDGGFDWSCETCGNNVFGSKQRCPLCLVKRGDSQRYFSNGKALKPGDWVCPNEDCPEVNFAKRSACWLCGHARKPLGDEDSTRKRHAEHAHADSDWRVKRARREPSQ
jgi:hypothetical protein